MMLFEKNAINHFSSQKKSAFMIRPYKNAERAKKNVVHGFLCAPRRKVTHFTVPEIKSHRCPVSRMSSGVARIDQISEIYPTRIFFVSH